MPSLDWTRTPPRAPTDPGAFAPRPRPALTVGAVVSYTHPSWGAVRGEVLRIGGEKGPADTATALCQDLTPTVGAREWWPVAELRVVGGAS